MPSVRGRVAHLRSNTTDVRAPETMAIWNYCYTRGPPTTSTLVRQFRFAG